MEAKKENQEFGAPETTAVETATKSKKFLGLTGKQWAGVGITAGTFLLGVFTGYRSGKKSGKKEGYVHGRCIGAVVNNCPKGAEEKASAIIGADVTAQKQADIEFVGKLKEKELI